MMRSVLRPIGLGDSSSSLGAVAGGSGAQEVLAILDAILTAWQTETHHTGVGVSTVPLNSPDYLIEQVDLAFIKSEDWCKCLQAVGAKKLEIRF
jgi:hypothetical protein